MKFIKIISRILLIVLCVSLVGCNQTNPAVIGEISESEETTRLVSETSNDRVIIVCPITYSFLSITDLDTYVRTGSKNINDYEKEPYTDLNIFPSDERWLKQVQTAYVPLEALFNIERATLDACCEATFQFQTDGGIRFAYAIDNSFISITYSPQQSQDKLSEIRSRYDYYPLRTKMESKNDLEACWIQREVNGHTILYMARNNITGSAWMVVGNYTIQIAGVWADSLEDPVKTMQIYNTFMTSSATAPFAVFFSEDDLTYNQAASALKANILLEEK